MERGPADTRLEGLIRALKGANTVAIVRLGSIGDVVATLPFAWFMREFLHGETRIVWIAHPAAGSLIRGVKALDEVVLLPRGHSWGTISAWRRILREVGADAVFDLHGNTKSGLVTRLTGARVRIGFDRRDCREILNCLATNWKLPPLSTGNKTLCAVEVARLLGHPHPVVRFDLQFTPEEMQRARAVIESWEAQRSPVILVQLGRLEDVRSWPPRNFAELTAALSSHRCNVVVLGGPDELNTGRVFQDLLGPPSPGVRLEIGTLSLREVGALCRLLAGQQPGTHAFVGSDSGCLHLAAACGLRTLGLFGPQDPARTAPIAPGVQIISHPESADCSPCSRRHCDHEMPAACMQSITPQEVLAELLRIPPVSGGLDAVESPANSAADMRASSAHVFAHSGWTSQPQQADDMDRPRKGFRVLRREGLALGGILALALTAFLIGVLHGGTLSRAEVEVVDAAAQIWPHAGVAMAVLEPGSSTGRPGAGHVLIAGFLHIFGANPFAARLPSVLAALGLLGITYLLARRLSDHITGLLAATLLLCTKGLFTTACTVNIALPAAFCIATSTLLYLEAARGTKAISQAAVPLAVLAAVLAGLIQGPTGLLIPAFTLLAFHAAERKLAPLCRPVLLISAVGALAVVAVWISFLGLSMRQSAGEGMSLFLHAHTPAASNPTWAAMLAALKGLFVEALPISLPAPFALFAHLKIRRYREDLGFGDGRWRLPKAALVTGLAVLAVAAAAQLAAPNGAALSLLPFLAVLVASWLMFTVRSRRAGSPAAD
jgi:heptosyltransferase-1